MPSVVKYLLSCSNIHPTLKWSNSGGGGSVGVWVCTENEGWGDWEWDKFGSLEGFEYIRTFHCWRKQVKKTNKMFCFSATNTSEKFHKGSMSKVFSSWIVSVRSPPLSAPSWAYLIASNVFPSTQEIGSIILPVANAFENVSNTISHWCCRIRT